jgi:hypothetical protein
MTVRTVHEYFQLYRIKIRKKLLLLQNASYEKFIIINNTALSSRVFFRSCLREGLILMIIV